MCLLPPVENISLGGWGKVFPGEDSSAPPPPPPPSLPVTPTSCRHRLASCLNSSAPEPPRASVSPAPPLYLTPPVPTAAALGTATHRLFCLDTDFPWHGRKLKYWFKPHAPPPGHCPHLPAQPGVLLGTSCAAPSSQRSRPSSLNDGANCMSQDTQMRMRQGLGVKAGARWEHREPTSANDTNTGGMLVRVWSCLQRGTRKKAGDRWPQPGVPTPTRT